MLFTMAVQGSTPAPAATGVPPVRGTEALFEAYGDMVYRLAALRTRSASDAEDILQEVFVRYLKRTPVFEDAEHQKAWFIRVTINCTKTLLTSAWHRHAVTGVEHEDAAPQQEDTSDVYEAVLALPKKYRTVVHLFYYEDYSIREIAELTGSTENTVKSQLFRARDMLRDRLKETYDYA